MAQQSKDSTQTSIITKSLILDKNESYIPEGNWVHLRNGVTHSKSGQEGVVGNEPSNLLCCSAPYTIIGAIHLFADKWAIFSTDDVNSEIGIFNEGSCHYTTLVNCPCLNFKKTNPIKGVSREGFNCDWMVYWGDALNPDRFMPLGIYSNGTDPNPAKLPWVQTETVINDCVIKENTTTLDCDAIRLAPLVKPPCVKLKKGSTGGTLRNGSYFAVIAYSIKGIRVTDYFAPSNIQSLFSHDNVSESLDVYIEDIDSEHFDEFELVIVETVNQQTDAKRIGFYNTHKIVSGAPRVISLDQIKENLQSISFSEITLTNTVYEKSDGLFEVNDYLMRVGPYSKLDFNYQPLANQIESEWISVEYHNDYYLKGGNVTSYMRDEVYSFFIRWIYNTGDRSASFHIPGRHSESYDLTTDSSADALIDTSENIVPYTWRVRNTATVTNLNPYILPDKGRIIASGKMGYWESTEKYPDDLHKVWNATAVSWSETTDTKYDLCGKEIRHHRFPDNFLLPGIGINVPSNANCTNHISDNAEYIRVLGVRFNNIKPPKDNDGNPISEIIGYEILRGSREGNKSVIAKGILNNMGSYTYEDGNTSNNKVGMYPNYPYNDVNDNSFLSVHPTKYVSTLVAGGTNEIKDAVTGNDYLPLPAASFSNEYYTFHSPTTQFKNPFLSPTELKVYSSIYGTVEGYYETPEGHPKQKLLSDLTFFVSLIGGFGIALESLNGTKTVIRESSQKGDKGALEVSASAQAMVLANAAALGFGGTLDELNTIAGIYNGILRVGEEFLDLGINQTGAMIPLLLIGQTENFFGSAVTSLTAFAEPFIPGLIGSKYTTSKTNGQWDNIPMPLKLLGAGAYLIPTLSYYFSEGTDTVLNLIKTIVPYQQYALQYMSHGFYNNSKPPVLGNQRRFIDKSIYLTPSIHDFYENVKINNLFRNSSVALRITNGLDKCLTCDNTRQTLKMIKENTTDFPILVDSNILDIDQSDFNPPTYHHPHRRFKTKTEVYYVAMKQRIRNQYGQLDSINQHPVSTCVTNKVYSTSPVYFNGDIYVSRYTEKNTLF
jgi:hypothetical protein